jgi:hypothetical protein
MNFLLIVVDEYDLNDDDEQQVMMLMIQVLILKNLLNESMSYLNFDDVLKINSDVEMSIVEQRMIDRHHHQHHCHLQLVHQVDYHYQFFDYVSNVFATRFVLKHSYSHVQ